MKKSIEITPLELLAAVNKATKKENVKKLMETAPVVSLLFTTFGAVLVDILFNEEDKNNE